MPELHFGAELRQRRHDAGLSLEALGKTANLTAGYLSKIENAHRLPPPETARALDRALNAGGALFARLPRPGAVYDHGWPSASSSTTARDEITDLIEASSLGTDGAVELRRRPTDDRAQKALATARGLAFGTELSQRRQQNGISPGQLAESTGLTPEDLAEIEAGHRLPSPDAARLLDRACDAGGMLLAHLPSLDLDLGSHSPVTSVDSTDAPPPGTVLRVPSRFDAALMAQDLSLLLEHLHGLGHSAAPVFVLPFAHELVSTARSAAEATNPRERGPLLTVAACAAEYAGWMAQEGGNMLAAGWWTDQAVILAELAGDPHLAAYASLRAADFALAKGNPIGVIEHARRADRHPAATPKARHLAALREAQGHALAVDDRACRAALRRAETLTGDAVADTSPYGLADLSYFQGVVSGWCLHDLGRYEEATEELDTALARIPPGSHRTAALYGARAANAHLAAGQLDEACDIGQRALAQARQTASGSARAELVRLHERLAHRPGRAARTLREELTVLLHEFG